ncbi:hypothetical protein SDC9_162304 [bioreactor metagenome]|uniref:Uncharacterized protein n=1 Tax=bioreactor metagenome TaxID=1076179 RepID=A0A645FKQ5_9ZZZZ
MKHEKYEQNRQQRQRNPAKIFEHDFEERFCSAGAIDLSRRNLAAIDDLEQNAVEEHRENRPYRRNADDAERVLIRLALGHRSGDADAEREDERNGDVPRGGAAAVKREGNKLLRHKDDHNEHQHI